MAVRDAPSFRSISDGFDNSLTVATISATLPANTAQYDGMVIDYVSATLAGGGVPTHTTPSGGWSVVFTATQANLGGVVDLRLTRYAKVAGIAEGAVTLTSNVNAVHLYARVSYQKVDLNNFISSVTPITGTLASASSQVIPSITTVDDNQLVVYSLVGATGGVTFTPPGDITERNDTQSYTYADFIQATAGATGTKTWTLSAAMQTLYGVSVFSGPISWNKTGTGQRFTTILGSPLGMGSVEGYIRGTFSSSGVSGTFSKTSSNDTLAASGTTTIVSTFSRTNLNDVLAATGTTTIVGTFSRTNINDALAASGTTTIVGILSVTNLNDILAANGSVGSSVSGTLAVTETGDGLVAAGTTTVSATFARTNNNDTLSAIGTTTVVGVFSKTALDDTLAALGTVGGDGGGVITTWRTLTNVGR